MLHANAAPGVHRVEEAYTNWYLVEDGGRPAVFCPGHTEALGATQAGTVLTGPGPPWMQGIESAVQHGRAAGAA